MRAILTVFAKEFRENLRDRRTLFTALVLGPLLGTAAVRRRFWRCRSSAAPRPGTGR